MNKGAVSQHIARGVLVRVRSSCAYFQRFVVTLEEASLYIAFECAGLLWCSEKPIRVK